MKKTMMNRPIADIIFDVIKFAIIAFLVIFTLSPILFITFTALSGTVDAGKFVPSKIDWFSLKWVLTNADFYRSYGVTIIVVGLGTLFSVICMSMLGYALSKKNLPGRKVIFVFFLISMLFSGGMVPNFVLMNTLGLTDTIFSLIFPGIVNVMNMILIKNYFEALPESLEESARIDGAGNFTIFFKIILPLSIPMIITISLFTAVAYWNNYTNALLYISSSASDLYPLPYFITQIASIFKDPNAAVNLGQAVAYFENIRAGIIIVSIIPVVILYPFFLKYFTKGVTVGSDK